MFVLMLVSISKAWSIVTLGFLDVSYVPWPVVYISGALFLMND